MAAKLWKASSAATGRRSFFIIVIPFFQKVLSGIGGVFPAGPHEGVFAVIGDFRRFAHDNVSGKVKNAAPIAVGVDNAVLLQEVAGGVGVGQNHQVRGAVNKGEFETFFLFWKEHKDMLVALDRSGLIGNLFDTTVSLAMTEYDRVRAYLSDSYDEDKEAAYRFVISGLMTMMIDWYRGGFKESVDTMARAMVKIITHPLFENLSRTE